MAPEASVSILGLRVEAQFRKWALASERQRRFRASISIVFKNHGKTQSLALTTELHQRHCKQHSAGQQLVIGVGDVPILF